MRDLWNWYVSIVFGAWMKALGATETWPLSLAFGAFVLPLVVLRVMLPLDVFVIAAFVCGLPAIVFVGHLLVAYLDDRL